MELCDAPKRNTRSKAKLKNDSEELSVTPKRKPRKKAKLNNDTEEYNDSDELSDTPKRNTAKKPKLKNPKRKLDSEDCSESDVLSDAPKRKPHKIAELKNDIEELSDSPKKNSPKKGKLKNDSETTKKKAPKKSKLKTGVVKVIDGQHSDFLNREVCYDLSQGLGLSIPEHVGVVPAASRITIDGKDYVYGAVADHNDPGKWKIEFENTALQSCFMDGAGVMQGIETANKLRHLRQQADSEANAASVTEVYETYIHAYVSDDEEQHVLGSDEEDVDLTCDDGGVDVEGSGCIKTRFDPNVTMKASDNVGETFLAVQDPDTAITWRLNVQLSTHPSKSTFGCTSLKKDAQSTFETPLQSFLAFLPVPIWQTMLKETIRFCDQQREAHPQGHISGNQWSSEVMLTELMTFISILLEMTLHPTPGRSHVHM